MDVNMSGLLLTLVSMSTALSGHELLADHAVFACKEEEVMLNYSLDSRVPASEMEEVSSHMRDTREELISFLLEFPKGTSHQC